MQDPLVPSQELLVNVRIPRGIVHGFTPEEQQYADTLDHKYVLGIARQWLVSHKQVPDFINRTAITNITFCFFCIGTLTRISNYNRSKARN
jgi:hypothetical protein